MARDPYSSEQVTSTGIRIVGGGQSRPAILDALRKAVVFTVDGHDGSVETLGDVAIAPFVRDVLLSDDRGWRVAVLAPLEDGGYLVQPTAGWRPRQRYRFTGPDRTSHDCHEHIAVGAAIRDRARGAAPDGDDVAVGGGGLA